MPSVRLALLLILHCRGYWNFSQMLMNASAFYRVAWILRELSWTLQDRVPFPLDALQAHGKFCLQGCHSVEFDVQDLPFWYRRSKDSSRQLPIPATVSCFHWMLLWVLVAVLWGDVSSQNGMTQHSTALHCTALPPHVLQ